MRLWDVFPGRAEEAHKPGAENKQVHRPWAEKTPEHHLTESWSTTAQSQPSSQPPHIPSRTCLSWAEPGLPFSCSSWCFPTELRLPGWEVKQTCTEFGGRAGSGFSLSCNSHGSLCLTPSQSPEPSTPSFLSMERE